MTSSEFFVDNSYCVINVENVFLRVISARRSEVLIAG